MLFAFVRPMARANRYIQNVPLNYIHLAAYLREKGHQPRIFDRVLDDATRGPWMDTSGRALVPGELGQEAGGGPGTRKSSA